MVATSPIGLHRVLAPKGVLPQAAHRLDASARIALDELRLDVRLLNLDAASFRQLSQAAQGDGDQVRAAVLKIVKERGKLHNPVTDSGGVLVGEVSEVGPACPLDLAPGELVATLASLTVTPLALRDALTSWDGLRPQAPCAGHAILFAGSQFARVPDDLSLGAALAVFDVSASAGLVTRLVRRESSGGAHPRVAVIGASGKSGVLACATAKATGAGSVIGIVPDAARAALLRAVGVTDEIAVADGRDAMAVARAVKVPADITVLCADAPDCEHGAIAATAAGGTVLFFSMTTQFTRAALGADGTAADVTMLIGNGFVPGQAPCALAVVRGHEGVRAFFEEHTTP